MTLRNDVVQVWCIGLNASAAGQTVLESVLSIEELKRGYSFATSNLRRRFMASRGILRMLLGHYLGVTPKSIVFGYGPAGKPFVADSRRTIAFNLSHSEDLAVFGFASDGVLGVDIERVRSMPDLDTVAERFLHPEEWAELLDVDEAERHIAFFRCWTRKEAYLKAVGRGLSLALDSFQVSLRTGELATLLSLPPEDDGRRWQIHDISHNEYAGAIVFDGRSREIEELPTIAVEELADILKREEQGSYFPAPVAR